VLVDGAQSVPHQKTDVAALDCDFLAFSGHKMLGPSGVGVLYGKRDLLERMPPFLGGGSMIRRVLLDHFEPGDLPAKFEAGTPAIVPVIGLGTAIDYLNRIGMEAIAVHERRLAERAHQVLSEIEGARILGPAPDKKTGIVSFTLGHVHAHDVAEVLDRRGIAIRAGHHCAMPLHRRYGVTATARASFYLYNTLAEVDELGPAVEQVQRVFHRKRK
jgi:cysteine desulfurase/selenocysteine lyase